MTPPYRRRLTWRTVALLVIAVLLIAWRTACEPALVRGPVVVEPASPETADLPRSAPIDEPITEGIYRIRRVVDGDTLVLDGGRRLRLIGVNAPESVKPDWPVEPWGPEASALVREFLNGQEVRLQFDLERVDQYDRLLGYVWVGDRLLNEELLRAGLARATLQYRFSDTMKRRFRAAQDEAKAARRGIWSPPTGGGSQHPSQNSRPRPASSTR